MLLADCFVSAGGGRANNTRKDGKVLHPALASGTKPRLTAKAH